MAQQTSNPASLQVPTQDLTCYKKNALSQPRLPYYSPQKDTSPQPLILVIDAEQSATR